MKKNKNNESIKKEESIWKYIKTNEVKITHNENLEEFICDYKPNSNKLISIKELKKEYKQKNNNKLIFDHVNFDIYENDVIALMGSNGAGKTTIVEIIGDIMQPTSGEVVFHYEPEIGYEKIGIQFQDNKFPNSLTVKNILNFVISMSTNNVDVNTLNEMLTVFKLKEFLNFKINKMSGGQQQRLNVIIALISRPKVLFLDEFTTGLDIAIKNQIKNYILKFAKQNKITIVLISHDTTIVNEMANRFIIIAKKTKILDATKEEIINKFGSVETMIEKYII
ncbi:MAG: ABC transporter ATP-binding protein [Ureaplasma sp.]|nr:ABC transporter ATP-binding protein [Ureaplasma sp.]